MDWLSLYALRSCSYLYLKLFPMVITSLSNSIFPSTIDNYFSPLLSPPLITIIMRTTRVAKAQDWTKVLNSLIESMWKNIKTNFGSKGRIEDTTIVNSIVMMIGMSTFSQPFLEFDFMPKFSTFTYMPICKPISCIQIFQTFGGNGIKGAIPIEHLCFKCNIPNFTI